MGRSRQRQRQRDRRRQQQSEARAASAEPTRRTPAPPQRTPPRRQGIGRGPLFGGGAVLLVALVAVAVLVARGSGGSGATPTSTPMPGQTSTAGLAPAVDGIHCLQNESLAYHIHQHIALYLDGKYMNLPAYIGFAITGSGNNETVKCLYWIHVHYETPNFIHVESPTKRVYTLGQFVDVWKATAATTQPPGSPFLTRLESAAPGQITAFVNGKRWTRGYRTIPLTEHEVITLEVGKPVVPPKPWTNWTPVD